MKRRATYIGAALALAAVLFVARGIAGSEGSSELTGILHVTKGYFLTIDGSLNSIELRGDRPRGLPDSTRLWVSGTITTRSVRSKGLGEHQVSDHWDVFMVVRDLAVGLRPFEGPKKPTNLPVQGTR